MSGKRKKEINKMHTLLKVPLFKGDLGGSGLSSQTIQSQYILFIYFPAIQCLITFVMARLSMTNHLP